MSRTIGDIYRDLAESREWDEFARWPPDVFALTSLILLESGAYRAVVSPPQGRRWPPDEWLQGIQDLAEAWVKWSIQNDPVRLDRLPAGHLKELLKRLEGAFPTPVSDLRDLTQDEHWNAFLAVVHLHACADAACRGLGIPGAAKKEARFTADANLRLLETGSLARISPDRVRVLPKLRTPQVGITLRSLSHNLAIDRSEVAVKWTYDFALCQEEEWRLNLLVFPWPFGIEPRDFVPCAELPGNMENGEFGLFEFDPETKLDPDQVGQAIETAKKRTGQVHGVVMPEGALRGDEVSQVLNVLASHGVKYLLTGVRGKRSNRAQLYMWDDLDRLWQDYPQSKHHRWCLDAGQIYQYHLGSTLHPAKRWWEFIDLPPRTLTFVSVNGWLTMCHLICEDLARQDPVSQVLRTVGPNLVIALLLDGPQLGSRWPARYASVLADDPGSSVLTVTSLGMALRSRPPGKGQSPVIALWKDRRTGQHELTLEPGAAQALLLTLCNHWVTEWTSDGRSDGGAAGELVLAGVEQIPCSP
jgi:hypothetical protein